VTRLPRGITRSAKGWRITVKIHGRLWQKRYHRDHTQEQIEQKLEIARKRLGAGMARGLSGSLAEDVRRYLADHFVGHAGYAERERHLNLWVQALGAQTWRSEITRDDVARVLNGWRAAGLAADTCNKRRTALLALYHALDGRGGSNPVREMPKFRAPDPRARGLAYPQIERALKQLPICKTRARLAVIAYTGMRHGQLAALKPDDWDHKRRVLTVPGTTKGRGTRPYVVPLSPDAQKALTKFDTLDAWGTFTTAPMARMWRAAWYAMTTGVKWKRELEVPSTFVAPVPYDLRHSFGTQVYRMTGDLKITKELMGHSAIRMTERYTLAAVPQRRQAAMKVAFPEKRKRSA